MEALAICKYYRDGDHRSDKSDQRSHVEFGPLLGAWINTRTDTKGFVKLTVVERNGSLFLRAFGSCTPQLSDWGEVEVTAFSDNVSSHGARAISAFYETEEVEVALQGNLNLGLLVLVTFNRFKDASNRSNYICREFFYRKSKTVGEEDR